MSLESQETEITPRNIRWLAGILEGEGSFSMSKRSNPCIQMGTNDKDVALRAAAILGVPYSTHAHELRSPGSYSCNYRLRAGSNLAIQWMMTLYSLMGNRRRAKIRELLDYWKGHTNMQNSQTTVHRNAWTD